MGIILDMLQSYGRTNSKNLYRAVVEEQRAFSETAVDYPPIRHSLLLNRELLPAKMKPAYSTLLEGYMKDLDRIRLPLPNGATADELMTIHSAVLYDHPGLYYVGKDITFQSGKNPIMLPKYTIKKSERRQYDALIQSKVDDIVSRAPAGSFARERYVNNYLLNTVRYGSTSDESRSHSVIGALIDGVAVCDGFSKATSLLLNSMGVSCSVVNGMLEEVSHAWNVVEINGERYHLDVTNNGGDLLRDCYFNLSDRLASRTHKFVFGFGCIDESRAYGGHACRISITQVCEFLTGFFYSKDRVAMMAVDEYSDSLFQKDIGRAMKQYDVAMRCRHSSNEKAGLYAIERIR